MQLTVYGAGYLGTVVSACLADMGTPVTCCDYDSEPIIERAQGRIGFYEKNLDEIIRRNVRAGRLMYSTEVEAEVNRSPVIFIAQDEPNSTEELVVRVAAAAKQESVIVLCTPSPVGTAARALDAIRKRGYPQSLVAHPLQLTDGCAVEDFNWPDRLLFGTRDNVAVSALKVIYRPLVMRGIPVIVTGYETAELAREAATAFVATKISFINEVATLCEAVKADAVDLALAMGLDKRIAPRCLQPGVRMGGSFVERDVDALDQLASNHGVSLRVLEAARQVNHALTDGILRKIGAVMNPILDKQVGMLGLAFKPHTSSIAGSASVALIRELAGQGARVRAYDPVAMEDAERELQHTVKLCRTPYEAAEGVDVLVVGTGWPEFRTLDYSRMKELLRQPIIVDTKNLLDSERLRRMGYQYFGVGRA